MTRDDLIREINRLRNRHVARTLDAIGDPDHRTVQAVKRGFSEIRDDFENILNAGYTGHEHNHR